MKVKIIKYSIFINFLIFLNTATKNYFIHGVYSFDPYEWYRKPESDWSIKKRFTGEYVYSFSWSANINPSHRPFYSEVFYCKSIEDIQANNEEKEVNIICHSHGGNVAFSNGNTEISNSQKDFLDLCRDKSIKVNYFLYETPVLPGTEKYMESLLEEYSSVVNICHYVAARDATQVIDIVSNFPFCNRFYNFCYKHQNFKQYLIDPEKRVSYRRLNHNSLSVFFNLVYFHLMENKNKGKYTENNANINLREVPHCNNRSLFNTLFFYHGGKIICFLASLYFLWSNKKYIKSKIISYKKKIKSFFIFK